MKRVNPELLEILVCPKCKAAVREKDGALLCSDPGCGLVYPVRDGVPVMLVEEATLSSRGQDGKKSAS